MESLIHNPVARMNYVHLCKTAKMLKLLHFFLLQLSTNMAGKSVKILTSCGGL